MRLNHWIPGAFAALGLAASAQAQVLFSEDFQDGKADGWHSAGKGTVSLSTYAGNVSLRLTGSASALIGLKIEGPGQLRISASMAAQKLGKKDACIAEASADSGKNWKSIVQVLPGQDDGLTLHKGAEVLAVAKTGGPPLLVRLRAAGKGRKHSCWADNITIEALAPAVKTGAASRQALSAGFLTGTADMVQPVPMRAYAPAPNAAPANGGFAGRLSFHVPAKASHMKVLRDRFGFMHEPLEGLKVPPGFSLDFVQVGARIVPVRRGLIRTDNQAWDIFVEPGRIWQEAGDNGFLRASIPFALQERNANCTHNGVLSFLFKPDGKTSRAAWQISSETCLYFQYNMWGTGTVRYTPGPVKNAARVRAQFEREQAARLPVRPISALAKDHPGLDARAFGSPKEVSPKAMTTFGVILDGVHYRGGCMTRHGRYPFCENLVIPSYSLAKSIFAGLGMMRLQKLYPEALDALIEDFVPACAKAGWKNVHFGQVLDMATGRYRSTKDEKDEDAAVRDGFFIVPSHREKIRRACTLYPPKSPPGTQWVYHTTDHYILGTAMQAFLRQRMGPAVDIYRDLLVNPVWKKLALSPVTYKTRRTRDDVGQPYTGWGLSFVPDDLARIARFINHDHGRIDGVDMLDATALRAALQQDPKDPGLPAPGKDFRYNNGFWAWNAGPVLKRKHPLWVPFMSGYGGISVVLMPNGMIYYYVSDKGQYAWARAVLAADHFRPFPGGAKP